MDTTVYYVSHLYRCARTHRGVGNAARKSGRAGLGSSSPKVPDHPLLDYSVPLRVAPATDTCAAMRIVLGTYYWQIVLEHKYQAQRQASFVLYSFDGVVSNTPRV